MSLAMPLTDTGSHFGSRLGSSHDCIRTGKRLRQKRGELKRLYYEVKRLRRGGEGFEVRLPSAIWRTLIEFHEDVERIINAADSSYLHQVQNPWSDIEAASLLVKFCPEKGRFLTEFARHFVPAIANLGDQPNVPCELVFRAISIAKSLTAPTPEEQQ